MIRDVATVGLLALFSFGPAVIAEEAPAPLLIGDPAPRLEGVAWERGEPVSEWSTGRVYVLDFWASWCQPCLEGFRSMQALQEQYAEQGVEVIAVAVWPNPASLPPEEVVARFPDLSYRFAIDRDDAAANRLLGDAGLSGLPNAIIVDRKGRVAWVGAPGDGLDEALEAIVSGGWDLEEARQGDQVRHRAGAFIQLASDAEQGGEFLAAIGFIDQAIEVDPARFATYRPWQYEIALLRLGDEAAAAEIAGRVLRAPPGEGHYPLYILALRIARNYEETPAHLRDLDLAFLAARRAVEEAPELRQNYLTVLAEVHALRGEFAAAAFRQGQALEIASEAEKPGIEAAFGEYKARAAER